MTKGSPKKKPRCYNACMTKKELKACCIRLPVEVHQHAKLSACMKGVSLQVWLADIILRELKNVGKLDAICHKDSVNENILQDKENVNLT
jgi:hypothetical protein